MSNWATQTPEGVRYIPISRMNETHLKKAYWWAGQRYTKYHNEGLNGNEKNAKQRKTLWYKLREMETIASVKNIKLNIPNQLIKNDIKLYNSK